MLGFKNADDYPRAGELLAQADYTERGIREILGGNSLLSVSAIEMPPWVRKTRGLSPRETLIRLFHLGAAVPEQAARRALEPMTLDEWIAAELLTPPRPDGNVDPRVKLLPILGGMFASDMPQIQGPEVRHDFVLPPGATTVQLAQAMIGRRSRRSLDLGTGCGLLACAAAPHSDVVVATDVSQRAVDFARFNAQLNGSRQIQCVVGNLFEPVAGQRFDLIVSNPPFVISPSRRLLFRDGGMQGDEFCRHLIRAAAESLEQGGFCQMLCNYAHQAGQPWKDGLTAWFDGLECDVLVWTDRTQDISDYAMTWIISTESQDAQEVPRLYDRWMDYYDQLGIEAVGYILVTMRRRDGATNWTRIDDSPRRIVGACGEEVFTCFRLRDFLATQEDDATLLDSPFRLPEAARIEQNYSMTPDGLAATETRLRLTGGVQYTLGLDNKVAGFIARCDGRTSLRELIGRLAGSLDLQPEQVIPAVLKTVRSLIDRGVLLPVDDECQSQ